MSDVIRVGVAGAAGKMGQAVCAAVEGDPGMVLAANRELYLVLANYGRAPVEVETSERFVPTDRSGEEAATRWMLPPRSLRILRRTN